MLFRSWARAYARQHQRPIVLISAGQFPDESFISPEDEASCCYLAMRLGLPVAMDSTDIYARWEREIILHGLEAIFRQSRHAQRLMEIGYSEDVIFCTRADSLSMLPLVENPVLLGDRQIGVRVRNSGA